MHKRSWLNILLGPEVGVLSLGLLGVLLGSSPAEARPFAYVSGFVRARPAYCGDRDGHRYRRCHGCRRHRRDSPHVGMELAGPTGRDRPLLDSRAPSLPICRSSIRRRSSWSLT